MCISRRVFQLESRGHFFGRLKVLRGQPSNWPRKSKTHTSHFLFFFLTFLSCKLRFRLWVLKTSICFVFCGKLANIFFSSSFLFPSLGTTAVSLRFFFFFFLELISFLLLALGTNIFLFVASNQFGFFLFSLGAFGALTLALIRSAERNFSLGVLMV